ncbi:DUF1642 domain-containing protein [Streptococcus suis]|uniref:DUF1642 domain-containing protein n=1 Tax=Streptococcus suis TaxID=1307 RepID=A0A426TGT6_STRSU|nr:DUF1642 domain-containing protein [Streptococcus suis]
MNKQEAIEKIYTASWDSPVYEGLVVKVETVNEIIFQIDEPQRVVVPKHIADKIKYCKDAEGYGLFHTMDYCYQYEDSAEWLEDNQETFAQAWLFGFEIEQEKLYTVEIPDPNRPDIVTFLYKENGKVFIGTDIFLDEAPNYKWKNEPGSQLTEAEIKEDFEWAWQFAKEVE